MNTTSLRNKNNNWTTAGAAMPLALLLGFTPPGVAGNTALSSSDAPASETPFSKLILNSTGGNSSATLNVNSADFITNYTGCGEINEPDRKMESISALGRRLIAIRKRIVESGVPLLDWDEVAAEKAKIRRDR